MASSVTLKITVLWDVRGQLMLELTGPNGDTQLIETRLNLANIDKWFDTFYKYVGRFQRSYSSLTSRDLSELSKVINILHENGCVLNLNLFGQSTRGTVESFFQQSIPDWESFGMPGKAPKIIQFEAQDQKLLIPLEFLPVYDTTKIPPIKNLDDLRKVACRFPGFGSIVNRVITRHKNVTGVTNDTINNNSGLRIRHFHHADLEGANIEGDFFRNTQGIELVDTWPNVVLSPVAFVNQLSSLVLHGYDVTAHPATEPDHIQHFSCHCDTSTSSDLDYSILLATKQKNWLGVPQLVIRDIKIRDFQIALGQMATPTTSKPNHPIIFLNACGAAKFDPGNMTSFPDFFFENKNSGFIGTETNVPDRFAASFSKQFYQKLLRGSNLGQAIYQTRWDQLLINQNPLGILYTVYANTDLRLFKPFLKINDLIDH